MDLKAGGDQALNWTNFFQYILNYTFFVFLKKGVSKVQICNDLWTVTDHMARREGQLKVTVGVFLIKRS